jgi:hypothetical protein
MHGGERGGGWGGVGVVCSEAKECVSQQEGSFKALPAASSIDLHMSAFLTPNTSVLSTAAAAAAAAAAVGGVCR